MSERRITSWTGSEYQRREQGVCLPPEKEAVQVPRFRIDPGKKCAIRKVMGGNWRSYLTIQATGFESYESYDDGYYTFRMLGWLLKIHRSQVWHREEHYPRGT